MAVADKIWWCELLRIEINIQQYRLLTEWEKRKGPKWKSGRGGDANEAEKANIQENQTDAQPSEADVQQIKKPTVPPPPKPDMDVVAKLDLEALKMVAKDDEDVPQKAFFHHLLEPH